jgi:tRNA1(Val) A37 N6-methylase TrmN6
MAIEETRRVHPREGNPPSRILILLARGAESPPREVPPLYLHEAGEKYCPEVRRICRLF